MGLRILVGGAAIGLAISASGCGATGAAVTRGQNPNGPAIGMQPDHRVRPVAAIQDHVQGSHTSYYSDRQAPACPPQGGTCPHGIHGGCRSCGTANDWYPKHHFSYSYSVPNDLKYPSPNAVGGAIAYPYYTFKGPSDFFRQK
ncbi:MAG: hypothetical protein DWH91_13055 [Planctomycetota bacterium]|nr:MAG: hypothetical protein DWH91_13055 [Planctomycetota bacterium]